jgi:hypothetical protein
MALAPATRRTHDALAMSMVRPVAIGRERMAAVEELQATVAAFTREMQERTLPPLSGAGWGPREILCHIVYWHEDYVTVLRAINGYESPPLKVGNFREFNDLAVRELGGIPADVLLGRLESAQRRLAIELLRMSPAARIRVKTGSMARGPVEFTRRVEGHIRGHLADVRRRSSTRVRWGIRTARSTRAAS